MLYHVRFILAPILLTNMFRPSTCLDIPAMFPGAKCTNCGITDSEVFRVAVIKAEILRRLGIQQPPLSNQTPPPIPIPLPEPEPRDHINQSTKGYELSDILSYSESPDNFTDENIIQFKLARDHTSRHLSVQSANLLIRVRYRQRNKKQRSGGTRSAAIKKRKRKRKQKLVDLVVSTVNAEGKPDKVITSVKSRMRKTKWLRLTLPQEQVQKAIESPDGTLQVYISCVGCGRRARPILVHRRRRKRGLNLGTKLKLHKRRPMLFLHTRVTTTGSRIRRSTRVGHCTATTGDQCCKRVFIFDFESIGWRHWILSPKRYKTAFCEGVCTGTSRRQGHQVAEIDQSVNSTVPEVSNMTTVTSSPRSCVPVRSRPLRLVYYNEEGVILQSVLPNMIVSKCGCR